MNTFYLGTHKPHWLAKAPVPLFVSRRTIGTLKKLPQAVCRWALDSGGFTELSMFGAWTMDARAYAAEVRRFRDEVGSLDWAAPQDWMCEPVMLAKTGKTVEEHQRLTVENFVELRSLAPDLPIVPVVQGWGLGDYFRCVELYERHGIDLTREPIVGVGTVCRRQGMVQGSLIFTQLNGLGLKLHGFGIKTNGLNNFADKITSADSLAWSFHARRRAPIEAHIGRHKNCANCIEYAMAWRSDVLSKIEGMNVS